MTGFETPEGIDPDEGEQSDGLQEPLTSAATAADLVDDADELTNEDGESPDGWTGGGFEPYAVGDPGRAAREVIPTVSDNPQDPADTQVDGAVLGSLVVRAASCRGISHRHSGTPRQDDYAVCASDDRWLIVAVADGVSAGHLSHQAATIACRGAAAAVRDALANDGALDDVPWKEVLEAVARRIVAHGRRVLDGEHEDEVAAPAEVAKAMASTLAVAVIPVEPDDDIRTCVIVALGDTSVFRLDPAGQWSPVTAVKNEGADIATSATVALPYIPADMPPPTSVELTPGDALFVMSDGVGDPLGRGDGIVGEFLAEAWDQPPDIVSFAGQVAFARRSFDDDRTVVGIWT